MYDTIRKVFRHPILDRNHGTREAQIPVAAFRPLRQYAPDGIGYTERRCAVYDFSVDGGAVSTITTTVPVYNNETVVDGIIVVDAACTTSAAGTLSIGLSTDGVAVLKAALAAASWAADATLPLIPLGHGTGEVKSTADQFVTFSIATGALTAGKVYVFFDVAFTGN